MEESNCCWWNKHATTENPVRDQYEVQVRKSYTCLENNWTMLNDNPLNWFILISSYLIFLKMSVLGSKNQNYSTSDDARKKFKQVASLTSDSTILGMFGPLSILTSWYQAAQKWCINDDGTQSSRKCELCDADRLDQTSYLAAKNISLKKYMIKIIVCERFRRNRVNYRCQNRNFNQCLLIICRLIFYYFNSNKAAGFCNPAFGNLPKCTLAKNFLDNVSVTQCLSDSSSIWTSLNWSNTQLVYKHNSDIKKTVNCFTLKCLLHFTSN